LEKVLCSSIKTASDIANEYKDLQSQERDDLNSKKHKLEAKVGYKDSEITSLGAKDRWHKWGYEIKSENLLQNYWDNECFKTKMQDRSIQPRLLTPPPLLPKPFALIGGLLRYSCKHCVNAPKIKNL
ncbi:3584_t:CDS:2, partial [Dentiscutata heterogama]